MKIYLEIPITPVAKQRARITRRGNYTPQKTRDFENDVRWWWQKSGHKMLPSVPTSLTVECHISAPKKKTKFDKPITRPDVDNYLKGIMDSLIGFAWADDNQIVDAHVYKYYTPVKPEIRIWIGWDES